MKLLVLKIAIFVCLAGAFIAFCYAVYNYQKIEIYKELKLNGPTDETP